VDVLTVWAQWSDLYFGVPLRQWIIWVLWLALGFFGIFPLIVAYMVWAERKIAARFQDRIGPNRVGPLGLLQPIADALKLITKENIVPRAADQWVHLLAPVMLLVSAFLVLAVVPFGFGALDERFRMTGLVAVDVPAGLLYLVAVSSISALGVFLAGWSSRNKYSLLGAMRAVAQLVSYEVPQVLATVPIILWTGGLSLVSMVDMQVEHGWWNVFSPPGALAFVLLTIANIAEVNRTPFDLPEAESEIIAGYHTEYSGMRFGLFFLAEYLSVFGVSCLGTVLFFGGGGLPGTDFPKSLLSDSWASLALVNAITAGIFFAKVFLYVFLMFWVRATLPRMRVDRLMNFSWKTLIPLGILNIVAAAVWQECVYGHNPNYLPRARDYLVGWAVTAPIVILSVVAILAINRAARAQARAEAGEAPAPAPAPTLAAR
jgi:NADH-quinone oxidoreductase subunit H